MIGPVSSTPLTRTPYDAPCGRLQIIASDRGLRALLWDAAGELAGIPAGISLVGDTVRRQLDAYFKGDRTTFEVPLDSVGTPFERRVWESLRDIPYGTTRSYSWQAERLRSPKAARAVGSANGRNPISIIVPCHRVVRQDGTLGGYAGGLDAKRYLLSLEASHHKH